jgi:hypothetical protein
VRDCSAADSLRRYPHLLDCTMAYSGMRHRELLALFRGELLRQLRSSDEGCHF